VKRISLFLFGALILSSCYSKEFDEPGRVEIDARPTNRAIQGDFARTWAATQKVVSRFPIEQKDSDPATERAFIVTDWVEGKSDVLYSGYGRNRIPYSIRYKVYIYVIGGRGQGTEVRLENVEQYRDDVVTSGVDFEGSINTWIRTETSTLKENRILDEIQKLVANANFQPEGQIYR
jgi:hypothetical protein